MIKTLLLAAAALVATAAVTESAIAMAVPNHYYYRPSRYLVSGVPGNSAPFRRSPCPGLNSLANHGYLPRNGQNITLAGLTNALVSVYNLGPELAAALANQVPVYPFNLDVLGTHNFVEHDASLVHSDAYFSREPNEVNVTLVADFLAYANAEKRIGIPEAGKARKNRVVTCLKENPQCDFGPTQARGAFLEAAALVGVMGGCRNNDTVSVAHARSFLLHERIPADYEKPESPFTIADLGTYSSRIAAFAK
ncbi:hypothetical protein PybrP1_006406 [[Pythium] brassicae (nom. inval.)]|nr:hypothetical protein PybrP1_006406 [[Pythium] brassicae (nom. inval.)]